MADSTLEKAAHSTSGLLIRTYLVPAMMALLIWLGNGYVTKLDLTMAAMAARQDRLEDAISRMSGQMQAIEAARDIGGKARDSDINNIRSDINILKQKQDLTISQISALSAKVEILLNAFPLRGNTSGDAGGSTVVR